MYLPIDQFNQMQTPFYYYDMEVLEKTLLRLTEAADKRSYKVHYALKANTNAKILERVRAYGLGADCVSGNEVALAIENGFPSSEVVFAGVGKTDREILLALENDIFCFNCESYQELQVIEELAASVGKKASIALRINPNIDAKTHHYISTGLVENKFGIGGDELQQAVELLKTSDTLSFIGIHFHIGSQITQSTPFIELCAKVNQLQDWLYAQGLVALHINVGGGLGVDYNNPDNDVVDFESFFKLFDRYLDLLPNQQLHFELGRSIVAQCGALVTKVQYLKRGVARNFLICDAGMTDLMRPALYNAYHKIENLSAANSQETLKYDVVGPICESSDSFGQQIELPESGRGDILVIRSAGAYGEVMANRYNSRDLITSYCSELQPA